MFWIGFGTGAFVGGLIVMIVTAACAAAGKE